MGLRGKHRHDRIQKIAKEYIDFLKESGQQTFTRSHLNTLFEGFKPRTKRQLVKEILTTAILNGFISESEVFKKYRTFENKPLSCNDYGSYSLMMLKNGYTRTLYKWVKGVKGNPVKKKIASFQMTEKIPSDLIGESDLIECKSYKQKQGVYSNSHLSVVKRTLTFKKLVYVLN
jgi:hypothetical protein